MQDTLQQYRNAFAECRKLFVQKNGDYGTAWRVLRPSSLTDQLFIKAQRIRTIEEKGIQHVADDTRSEFVGIVNYGIIVLIQLSLPNNYPLELSLTDATDRYDEQRNDCEQLMLRKKRLFPPPLCYFILMKIWRVKQIEDNKGKTIVSEGLAANYMDMINYALFALLKLS